VNVFYLARTYLKKQKTASRTAAAARCRPHGAKELIQGPFLLFARAMHNGEQWRKIRASAEASPRKGAQGRARRTQVRASPAAPSSPKNSRASGRARPFCAAAQGRASAKLEFVL